MKGLISLLVLIVGLVPMFATSGCAAGASHEVAMAPVDVLPPHVHSAPARVREAYQFALANPAALESVPCYCGCVGAGHRNNYACYVSGVDAGGSVEFDLHALNCMVCVDITHDVMRMTREGQGSGAIQRYIVSNYSRFGPPTQ